MRTSSSSKLLAYFAGFSLLAACSGSNSTQNELSSQLSQTENETTVEAVIEKAFDQVDRELAVLEENDFFIQTTQGDETGDCRPGISIDKPVVGRFPVTITLDYGEGCLDKNKNFRAGSISVHLSGPYWEENTIRQSRLSGYIYNDMRIEGTRTEVNLGRNEKGNYVFDVRQHEKIRSEKDQIVSERELVRTREYSRGSDLLNNSDDEVWITGKSRVITQGKDLTREIVKPLYRSYSCGGPFYQEGVVLTYSGKKELCKLDYGQDCNEQALLTCRDGASKTITLTTWVDHYSVKP